MNLVEFAVFEWVAANLTGWLLVWALGANCTEHPGGHPFNWRAAVGWWLYCRWLDRRRDRDQNARDEIAQLAPWDTL